MAAIELNNCDDFCVNVPFDLALELTKIYYGCKVNNERNYYKSDILEIYNYFKTELGGNDNDNETENQEYSSDTNNYCGNSW